MKNAFEIIKGNKKQALIGVIILTILIAMPHIFSSGFSQHVMIMMCIWAILGMGWNFIGGYAGQVSNGHSLYYAFGAYTSAVCVQWFNISPWIGMWIGVIISALIAFLIGKPLLRLRGPIFAIATMAIAESGRIAFINIKQIGGATGMFLYNVNLPAFSFMQFRNNYIYYYVYLTFALLILLLTKVLDKSKFCYYLRAIRGNETAAESIGINTSKYKIMAYMLSAGIVSLAGSLYAQFMLYFDPASIMTLNISMMIVLVAVMGGIGTVVGPVVGAVILTYISEYTRVYLGKFGGLDMIFYGLVVIVIVLFLPNGLVSLKDKFKNIKLSKKKFNGINKIGKEVAK